MKKKRNSFRVVLTLIICLVVGGLTVFGPPVRANDQPREMPRGLTQMVDALLKNIRTRDRDGAFAVLSQSAQDKLGATPKAFMNTVRLFHHPLYDHAGYRVIGPATQLAATRPILTEMMVRVQLMDHDDHETLLLLRVGQDKQGVWHVHGLTTLQDDAGRDA